jgi:proteasome lid subunit RPN8/RPN11
MGVVKEHTGPKAAASPAADEQNHIFGGIDFARLATRELSHLSGERSSDFQVIIHQSALNRIHAHGGATPRIEVCGVLVGDVYRDDHGPYLLVEQIVEGAAANGGMGQVTFTAATWQHIQSTMDEQFPENRIVGWYHTHPGHGIFLSEMDVFLHESFFGLPWQTALVYDPQTGEEGLFHTELGQPHKITFLTEGDEPAAKLPGMGFNQASAQPLVLQPIKKPKLPCESVVRKTFKAVLAMIGLILFAAAGMLAGIMVRMQHLQIPDWILRMARK